MCRIYVQDIVLTVFSSLTIDPVTGESNKTDQLTLYEPSCALTHTHTPALETGGHISSNTRVHTCPTTSVISWHVSPGHWATGHVSPVVMWSVVTRIMVSGVFMCHTRASPAHGHHNCLIWSQVILTLSTQSTLHLTHHCHTEKKYQFE